MPREIAAKLRELIERPTRLFEILFFGIGLFSVAVPDWPKIPNLEYWKQFGTVQDAFRDFAPRIAPLLLAGVTIYWYYRFKTSALKELDQIDRLFDDETTPIHTANIAWARVLPFMGYMIVGVFCVLVFSTPYLSLYCMAAFMLHANDLMGQAIMVQNLNKTLMTFPVRASGWRAEIAKKRREVIIEYYYDNLTFPRIAGIFICTAIAFIISVKVAPTYPVFGLVAYGIMMANILVGEKIMTVWRRKRDQKLEEITLDEERNYLSDTAGVET